ncbi:hypothetical protein JXA63_02100 [Candidatus Woesebacteria bacterium]|nr:hypothetical protein [Candidatus Woesebacteria bacterium]
MSGERISLSLDKSVERSYKDGTSVRARVILPQRADPGSTAIHEAVHVVAAGEIVSATNIPSGDALGTTRPVRMTAIAASAPAALGHSGAGWDKFITENYLGMDFDTAKRAARSALAGKEKEIEAVAIQIEEKRRITQTDVDEARRSVAQQEQGIFPVEVTVVKSGTVYSYTTNSSRGEIQISDIGSEDDLSSEY